MAKLAFDHELMDAVATALCLPPRCRRFTMTGGVGELLTITAECHVDPESLDLSKLTEIPVEVHVYEIRRKQESEESIQRNPMT